MDLTPHHLAVATALSLLDSTLQKFVTALAHSSIAIQLDNAAHGSELRQAAEAFAAIS